MTHEVPINVPQFPELKELFEAVEEGDVGTVETRLITDTRNIGDFLKVDTVHHRTILHYACERSHKMGNKDAVETVKVIYRKALNRLKEDDKQLLVFLDKADKNGICALHIALQHRNRELVKFLLYKGADVNLIPRNKPEKEIIRQIYKEMPEILLDLFESHLNWKEDERDAAEQMRDFEWDFSPVTTVLPTYLLNYEVEQIKLVFEKGVELEMSDSVLLTFFALHLPELRYKPAIQFTLRENTREIVRSVLDGKNKNIVIADDDHDHDVERKEIQNSFKDLPDELCKLFEKHLEKNLVTEDKPNLLDFAELLNELRKLEEGRVDLLESQTANLTGALHEKKVTQSQILLHPLVQMFMHEKHDKFIWLIFFSILYHCFWSLVSICFLSHYARFPQVNTTELGGGTARFETWSWGYLGPFAIFFAITALKEFTEFKTCPSKLFYIKQWENRGQVYLLISILIVGLLPFEDLRHFCGATGIFVAGLLTLGQMNKTECFGIYMEMLMKVTKKIFQFLGLYCPLIFTYAKIFNVLMPGKPEFMFFGVIPKVVTMMTGEVGYDEVFHDDEDENPPQQPGLAKFIFLLFDLTVVIVLQNLLIALTISEIKELNEKAKEKHLAKQLEQINLIERFFLSKWVKWIIKKMRWDGYLHGLMVEPKGTEKFERLPDPIVTIIKEAMVDKPERFKKRP